MISPNVLVVGLYVFSVHIVLGLFIKYNEAIVGTVVQGPLYSRVIWMFIFCLYNIFVFI